MLFLDLNLAPPLPGFTARGAHVCIRVSTQDAGFSGEKQAS